MKIPEDIGFSAVRSKPKAVRWLCAWSRPVRARTRCVATAEWIRPRRWDQRPGRPPRWGCAGCHRDVDFHWEWIGATGALWADTQQRWWDRAQLFLRIVTNIHFSLGKSVGQFEETRSHSYHFSTLPLKDRNHIYTTGSFGNKDWRRIPQ